MDNEHQLLIKQFQHFNIEIYGTYEDPLFKANDIANLLGIKDIRTTLRDFDKDEWHTMPVIDNLGRRQRPAHWEAQPTFYNKKVLHEVKGPKALFFFEFYLL